jgi:hypothetical protein
VIYGSLTNVALVVIGSIVICLGIARAITLHSPRHTGQTDNSEPDHTNQPSEEPQSIGNWFRILVCGEAIITQANPTQEQHRATEQVYWRETLRKQKHLNIITAVAAGVGLIGLIIVGLTLKQTMIATGTAQQEFELSQRPWVYPTPSITKPITYDAKGANIAITIHFALTNIGHSPAVRTQIVMNGLPYINDAKVDPVALQKHVCGDARKSPNAFLPITIFPEQKVEQGEDRSVYINLQTLKQVYGAFESQSGERLAPSFNTFEVIIIGCIDYQFEFRKGHHQTPFIWQILRHDPNNATLRFMLHWGENVPVANIALENWPMLTASSEAD